MQKPFLLCLFITVALVIGLVAGKGTAQMPTPAPCPTTSPYNQSTPCPALTMMPSPRPSMRP